VERQRGHQARGTCALGRFGSVGGPAAVDGQDGAGDVPGLRVGEEQRGAGELGGVGPAAERDLGRQETPHLWVVVGAGVEGEFGTGLGPGR